MPTRNTTRKKNETGPSSSIRYEYYRNTVKAGYARLTLTNRIALPILYASLAIAVTMLALDPPRRESPAVKTDNTAPIIGSLSGTGNTFTESFTAERNGLRSVWIYLGFNKLSPEEKDRNPRILIELRNERGETVVSDYTKLTDLKRDRPNDLRLGKFVDAPGERFTYSFTSENISESNPILIRSDHGTSEGAATPEYAPNIKEILTDHSHLFFPSLFMTAFLITLIFNSSDNKPSSRGIGSRRIFYLYAIPVLFVNGLFFMFWVNHFAPIDEHSHFEYVKTVAKGRLPLLFEESGRRGPLEAFQPPLYYVTAAPLAALLDGNLQEHAVRFLGLLVYLGFVVLAFEMHLALRRRFAFLDSNLSATFLVVFVALSPSLIIRSVCISNGTFAALFIMIQALLLIRSTNRPTTTCDAIATGSVTGLSLLSRFTNLYSVPIIAWNIMIRGKQKALRVTLFVAGMLALLAPWFTWNLTNYGSLTPNRKALEYQMPYVNPDGRAYGTDFIRKHFHYMFDTMSTPEEYGVQNGSFARKSIRIISWTSIIALATAFVYLMTHFRSAFDPQRKDFILVLLAGFPILNVLQQLTVVILHNWPVMLGRYLHASLPFFGIFALLAVSRIVRNQTAFRIILLVSSLGMIVLNANYLAIVVSRFG